MNEMLRQIGLELRRRSQSILRRPMNWRMIDTVVRLEETEEQRVLDAQRSQDMRDNDQQSDGLIWRAANDDSKSSDGDERR
jgi:hypothetical protein